MRIYIFIVLLLVHSLFVMGCSEAAPPSKANIQAAITSNLQNEVPVSWAGNLMGGRSAKLSSIEIIKRGLYNKKERYWPYRIHVKGVCSLNAPFNKKKQVSFDKAGDFILYKDDYGDWKATLRGDMFQ